MARFFAVAMSHAPGLSGTPLLVQCSSAASHESCAISSARPTSRSIRASFAMILADSMCHMASIVRSISSRFTVSPRRSGEILGSENRPDFDVGIGQHRIRAALDPLDRLLDRAYLPQPITGNQFLGLRKRTVGHGARGPGKAHALAEPAGL